MSPLNRLAISSAIVASILVATSVSALAQSDAEESKAINSLRDGASAILFEVVGDFDLTSFDGANLSFKHHYTDNRAYRIGLSVSIASDDYDASEGIVLWEDIETRSETATLTALKLHCRSINRRGSLYWGVGPRAMYSRTTSMASSIDDEGRGRRFESEKYSFGVLGAIGVEWFIDEQISLLGQYGTIVEYRKSSSCTSERYGDPEFDYSINDETSSWILNPDVVRFGLSFYW